MDLTGNASQVEVVVSPHGHRPKARGVLLAVAMEETTKLLLFCLARASGSCLVPCLKCQGSTSTKGSVGCFYSETSYYFDIGAGFLNAFN
ncbi:hypothetical protein V6N11_040315 [Hibiscus sabdariffa]|uniref:Uncharacterized protein n=1 Tax=Hibiscus sabdariffa TaxID=183260 RepID=A0ABR2RH35_9ROSI